MRNEACKTHMGIMYTLEVGHWQLLYTNGSWQPLYTLGSFHSTLPTSDQPCSAW